MGSLSGAFASYGNVDQISSLNRATSLRQDYSSGIFMTPSLLEYLCDPRTKEPLSLIAPQFDPAGRIVTGILKSRGGATYPITNGIPRFVTSANLAKSVKSFGDEWNYFNFREFKAHWLNHTVANTFGTADVFNQKVVVDAGGGSGSQTLWMLESGAKHVIMLELSHSVDDVVKRNLEPSGFTNYDVVQCSIDMPPIKDHSIPGIVICHNVIQHTPSVEKTAGALFSIVAPGGEFVFNCYAFYENDLFRQAKFHLVYRPLRALLSRMPFWAILWYSRVMGGIRMIPGVGFIIERTGFCVRGDVPQAGDKYWEQFRRKYSATVLNTFDWFGSHSYQHHKRDDEIRRLVANLQPAPGKLLNAGKYFQRPRPPGCALRILR